MSHGEIIPQEEWLQHRAWLRSLARDLLDDPSAVDDVLQDVWLAAIAKPPRRESLGTWLRHVVRNRSFKINLSERRRGNRQRMASRREAVPAESDVLERLETQARMARCVAELPAIYRDVVFLRYYEELDASQIAKRLGVSASTVRTRLARGLERIRQQLDRDFDGDRRAWAGLLVPYALMAGDSASLAPLSTIVAERSRLLSALPLLAAVALFGVLSFWAWQEWGDNTTKQSAPTLAVANVPSKPRSQLEAASRSPRLSRRTATPGEENDLPSSVTDGSRVQAVARADEPRFTLSVFDQVDERPLPSVDVFLRPFDAKDATPVHIGSTDSAGELSWPTTEAFDGIWLSASGYVCYFQETTLKELESESFSIELRRESTGTVTLRWPDQSPASGIEIDILGTTPTHLDKQRLRTDHNGQAVFRVRCHEHELHLERRGIATLRQALTGSAVDVELRDGHLWPLEVVDESGAAVVDCRVTYRSAFAQTVPRETHTDATGRAFLGNVAVGDQFQLQLVAADGRNQLVSTTVPNTADVTPHGARLWRVVLQSGVEVRGRVSWDDGTAAPETRLFLLTATETTLPPGRRRTSHRMVPLLRCDTDANGEFILGPIMPPTSAPLFLFCFRSDAVNQLVALDPNHVSNEVDVVLSPGATLRGEVRAADGQALENLYLFLGEAWRPLATIDDKESPSSAVMIEAIENIVGRARTDANGQFEIRGVPLEIVEELSGAGNTRWQRSHLYITAYPPDELLIENALHGTDVDDGDGRLAISGSRVLTDGEFQVELTATARPHGRSLGLCLHEAGEPIEFWLRGVFVDPLGNLHSGLISNGPQGNGKGPGPASRRQGVARFFGEHAIQHFDTVTSSLLICPDHLPWRWYRWKSVDGTTPNVELDVPGDRHVVVRDDRGEPQPHALVYAPEGDRWRPCGRADARGRIRFHGAWPDAVRLAVRDGDRYVELGTSALPVLELSVGASKP